MIFDAHNDLPHQLREGRFDTIDLRRPQPALHTDLPRLIAGGVRAVFWVAYVPPELARLGTAGDYALRQIELIHRMIDRYRDTLAFADSAAGVEQAIAAGRIASLIAVEGGHALQNALAPLARWRQLGVRYLTLTHTETTDWCDSATDTPRHAGLSPFGEDVIRELHRVGILPDIAHIAHPAMRQVLAIPGGPVIASHAGACAVADHVRNLPDDVLISLARTGGIACATFYPGYIVPVAAANTARDFEQRRTLRQRFPDDRDFKREWELWRREHPIPRGSAQTVVAHLAHMVRLAGPAAVGIGSDFDGIGLLPEGLEHPGDLPNLTQAMRAAGFDPELIQAILGRNLLDVLRRADP